MRHTSDMPITIQIAGACVDVAATVTFRAVGNRLSPAGADVEVIEIAVTLAGKHVALPAALVNALAPGMADTLAEIAADQKSFPIKS